MSDTTQLESQGDDRKPEPSKQEWTWVMDSDPVSAELGLESQDAGGEGHPVADPALVIAVRLRLEGAPEDALKELEQAKESEDSLLLAGQVLFEIERYEEAAEKFRVLADNYAGHPFASFNRAICQIRQYKWRDAIESLQRALVVDPKQPKAWFALGICFLNRRQPVDAKPCFAKSLNLQPDYVPALFGLAAALQMLGSHAEALQIYERMLEGGQDREELLANALTAAMNGENSQKAAEFATRLRAAKPRSPAALFALFSLSADRGEFDRAAEWSSRLAESTPDDFDAWYNMGICKSRLRQYREAARAFERAVELRSDEVDAIEGLAQAYAMIPLPQKAMHTWFKLLQLTPDRDDCWFQLGTLRHRAGEPAEAAQAFEKCVALSAGWVDAWVNLGTCRWDAGDESGAKQAFEQVLALEEDNLSARRALAAIAIEAKDPETAARYCRETNEDNWDVVYNLATLHQSLGKLELAAKRYRQVVAAEPEFAKAWLNLGNVLFAQGNLEESRSCWRKALEKEPDLAAQFLSVSPEASA